MAICLFWVCVFTYVPQRAEPEPTNTIFVCHIQHRSSGRIRDLKTITLVIFVQSRYPAYSSVRDTGKAARDAPKPSWDAPTASEGHLSTPREAPRHWQVPKHSSINRTCFTELILAPAGDPRARTNPCHSLIQCQGWGGRWVGIIPSRSTKMP